MELLHQDIELLEKTLRASLCTVSFQDDKFSLCLPNTCVVLTYDINY